MALVVNNATVATGMSPVVERALYADAVLMDGVTFTSKFSIGNVGQIQVVKYNPDGTVQPTTPGSDFNDSAYTNNVIDINCNNGFQKSQKVPQYYVNTMPVSLLIEETWNLTESVRIGRQKTALANLVHEGTATSGAVVTASNIKDIILNQRAVLREKNCTPDVIICSVAVYTEMLKYAGTEFIPQTNESIVSTGRVGKWMGILWVECSQLDGASTYKYIDQSGTVQTQSMANVDFILYDHEAFSIIDRLNLLRIIDSEHFSGSKIQQELASGFKVTNPGCVTVYKHTTASNGASG